MTDYIARQLRFAGYYADGGNYILAQDALRRALDGIGPLVEQERRSSFTHHRTESIMKICTVHPDARQLAEIAEFDELFDGPTERPEPLPDITDAELFELFGE